MIVTITPALRWIGIVRPVGAAYAIAVWTDRSMVTSPHRCLELLFATVRTTPLCKTTIKSHVQHEVRVHCMLESDRIASQPDY